MDEYLKSMKDFMPAGVETAESQINEKSKIDEELVIPVEKIPQQTSSSDEQILNTDVDDGFLKYLAPQGVVVRRYILKK